MYSIFFFKDVNFDTGNSYFDPCGLFKPVIEMAERESKPQLDLLLGF